MAATSRQLAARTAQAYEQGSHKQGAARQEVRKALGEPSAIKAATDATVEGLFDIYERKSQVIMGIKEVALKVQEAGSVVDTFA